MALMHAGKAGEVIALCENGMKKGQNPAIVAHWQNNLAYTLARFRREPNQIERARSLACASVNAMPWVSNFHGTLGIVLIEAGESWPGLSRLLVADRLNTDPQSVAIRSAWRSLAYAQLGRFHDARAALERARLDCPDKDLIDDTVRRIAALEAA